LSATDFVHRVRAIWQLLPPLTKPSILTVTKIIGHLTDWQFHGLAGVACFLIVL